MLQVSEETESRTNSEADTGSSGPQSVLPPIRLLEHQSLPARYTDIQSVETNQTARISLQLSSNVKEPYTPEKKSDQHANPSAHPPNKSSRCPQSLLSVSTVFPVRQAASPTRHQRLSSAGEGGSKIIQPNPQVENSTIPQKSFFKRFLIIFQYLNHTPPTISATTR